MTERLAVWSSRRPWLTLAGWALALVAAIAISAAFLGDALSGDEEVTSDTESRRADELEFERFAEERGGRRAPPRWSSFAPGRRRSMSHASSGGCGDRSGAAASGCDPGHHLLRHRRAAAGLSGSRCHGDARGPRPRCRGRHRGRRRRRAGRRRSSGVRRHDHRRVHARRRLLDAGRGGPAQRRAGVRIAGCADRAADRLRLRGGGAHPVADGDRLDRRRPRARGARRAGVSALGLRHEHAHRDGARARDRLLAVRPLRYREERLHGRERLDAIAAVGATASRAVLFSGIAFTLAMVGLLLVPHTIMRSLAAGAIVAGWSRSPPR